MGRTRRLPGDMSFTLGTRPPSLDLHETSGHGQLHNVTAARARAEEVLSPLTPVP